MAGSDQGAGRLCNGLSLSGPSYPKYILFAALAAAGISAACYPDAAKEFFQNTFQMAGIGVKVAKETPSLVNILGDTTKVAYGLGYWVGKPLALMRDGANWAFNANLTSATTETEIVGLGATFAVNAFAVSKIALPVLAVVTPAGAIPAAIITALPYAYTTYRTVVG